MTAAAHRIDPATLPGKDHHVWVVVAAGNPERPQVLRGCREGARWAERWPWEPWETNGLVLLDVLTSDPTFARTTTEEDA